MAERVRATHMIWHNLWDRYVYVCDNCAARIEAGAESSSSAWDANQCEPLPIGVDQSCVFVSHPAPKQP